MRQKHKGFILKILAGTRRVECASLGSLGGNSAEGHDVPGWDPVAPVCTGWTSQRWKGERLSVWAPCAGPTCKTRAVCNTWSHFGGARAPLGSRARGLVSGEDVIRRSWSRSGDKTTEGRTGTGILTTLHDPRSVSEAAAPPPAAVSRCSF